MVLDEDISSWKKLGARGTCAEVLDIHRNPLISDISIFDSTQAI
jgi:hypothetical protein